MYEGNIESGCSTTGELDWIVRRPIADISDIPLDLILKIMSFFSSHHKVLLYGSKFQTLHKLLNFPLTFKRHTVVCMLVGVSHMEYDLLERHIVGRY
jgi:hypothetical protein